jgi:ribokinase
MSEVGGVAVVGSINVDLTVFATPLPRPGETVIGDSFSMVLGGKGANQAVAAVRAGADTCLVGAVGDDVFGELMLSRLMAEGIDTSQVRIGHGETGVAHIRVDAATGQNDIAIVPNANHSVTGDDVEEALRALAGRVAVVLVQLEIPLPVVRRTASVCRELGLTLILDPAPAQPLPDDVWSGIGVITPNELEAETLSGIVVQDQTSAAAAGRWFLDRGVQTAVITRAASGITVVSPDGVVERPAYRVTAVDTTAAGDAFAGALGAALAHGRTLEDALQRGLAAGALAVTVRGASPSLPNAAAIDEFLAAQGADGSG